MHAYIITGGTSDERSDRINKLLSKRSVSAYDTITIIPEPTSIGVDSVRGIAARLSIHPVASAGHAVIVRDAQTMTPEAQNAFLKTLEEPPGDAIIILETSHVDALLPTILSRCQLVNLGAHPSYTDEQRSECMRTITSLVESSVGKRLQMIDTLTKTKGDALSFVNLAIAALEKDLKKTGSHAKILRALLMARTHVLGNITPKLAIDAAFLYNDS